MSMQLVWILLAVGFLCGCVAQHEYRGESERTTSLYETNPSPIQVFSPSSLSLVGSNTMCTSLVGHAMPVPKNKHGPPAVYHVYPHAITDVGYEGYCCLCVYIKEIACLLSDRHHSSFLLHQHKHSRYQHTFTHPHQTNSHNALHHRHHRRHGRLCQRHCSRPLRPRRLERILRPERRRRQDAL